MANQTPGFTEPTLTRLASSLRANCRHGSARARGLTRQLCTRSIRCRDPLHRLRGALSLIPTAANCRDSQETNRARPKKQNGRETSSGQNRNSPRVVARGQGNSNTARGSACRPRTSNMAARLRPAKDMGNSREHGHFPTAAFRWRSIPPLGKMADLTDKSKLV